MKYFIGKVRNRNSSTGILGTNRYIGVRGCTLGEATRVVQHNAIALGISEMVLELSEIHCSKRNTRGGNYTIVYSLNGDINTHTYYCTGVDPITCMIAFIHTKLSTSNFVLIHSLTPTVEELIAYHVEYTELGDTRKFGILAYSESDAKNRISEHISPYYVGRLLADRVYEKVGGLGDTLESYLISCSYMRFDGHVDDISCVISGYSENDAYYKFLLMSLVEGVYIELISIKLRPSANDYRVNCVISGYGISEGHSEIVSAYSEGDAKTLIECKYCNRIVSMSVVKVNILRYRVAYVVIESGIDTLKTELVEGYSLGRIISNLEKLEGFKFISSMVKVN